MIASKGCSFKVTNSEGFDTLEVWNGKELICHQQYADMRRHTTWVPCDLPSADVVEIKKIIKVLYGWDHAICGM